MNAVSSGGIVNRNGVQAVHGQRPGVARTPQTVGGFQDVLRQRLAADKVRFSAHASERLRSAGVQVDGRFEERLQNAVDKAAAKGARSSLVLLDQLALVVSVQNRTVITAIDSARMKDNVFTNIDSAVIT